MTLIKICGISDPNMAYQVAELGADFVGLVFHPASKRYVNLEQAAMIAAQVKKGGAIPVAVCVSQTAAEIQEICKVCALDTVQLHGDAARAAHLTLAENIKRIYVIAISAGGELCHSIPTDLEPSRDYLLFDGIEGGSGQLTNFKALKSITHFPFFIAGGLNHHNILALINKYQPSAVDISSGVEIYPGQKDLNKIEQFITTVKWGH